MDLITALAVVIGVMGGLATWAAVTVGSPYLLIWAIFIGWASFFHCGGKTDGLKASAVANVWGAICAAVAFIALLSLGVTATNAGLCVGVTVLVMIAAAKVPALGAIPAGVYGYAATAGLFLLGSASYGEGTGAVIGVAGAVAVSMVIGNVLGLISEKIAGALLGGSRHKYAGGCAHIHTHSDAEPIDNHTCHCSVCKSVTGQLNTHVVFFKHGDLKVDHPEKMTRMPFNADNPNGPLELCVCNDCGTPIMLDDKEKRIRVIVPNLMGYEAEMPASYHAFYNPDAKGILPEPNDGRPVYPGLRPEFTWPKGA